MPRTRAIFSLELSLILALCTGAHTAWGQATDKVIAPAADSSSEHSHFSDSFDSLNLDHWQPVLLYSKTRGTVGAGDGALTLKTLDNTPTEVQVYSLFTLEGDFDLETQYDLTANEGWGPCRFNGGLVLQTLGDEKSYKCYIGLSPEKDLLFRSRLDQYGEVSLETSKSDSAPLHGMLRIVRKAGEISNFVREDPSREWRKVYAFQARCTEKLRLRFKLQTGSDDEREKKQACPIILRFKQFKVNRCDRIRME